jgi:hypothetical protein
VLPSFEGSRSSGCAAAVAFILPLAFMVFFSLFFSAFVLAPFYASSKRLVEQKRMATGG